MNATTTLGALELEELVDCALTAHGFSSANARSLARQTVLSEQLGQSGVGVAHVFDYTDAAARGALDARAEPQVTRPVAAMIAVDGQSGLPQTGFDMAFDDLVATARDFGLCLFGQKNTTLCGSLGTFAVRLADQGLVSLAATNGSPLLAGSGGKQAVFCTNPMAFAAPQQDGPPLLIDQSSSATAYVNIRQAAQSGEEIPAGWALDRHGEPTTDPKAALEGTLLAFGGARGANIALMVEVLAAGLTGANWSLDAPSFFDGDACPDTGLLVLAINPLLVAPDFTARMASQLARLQNEYGLYIPGLSKAQSRRKSASTGIEVQTHLVDRLRDMARKTD